MKLKHKKVNAAPEVKEAETEAAETQEEEQPKPSVPVKKKKHIFRKFLLILIALIVVAGAVACVIGHPHVSDGTVYFTVIKGKSGISAGDLILVNAEHVYDFDKTPELVNIAAKKNNAYLVRNDSAQLEKTTLKQFNKMFKAFKKDTGVKNICINSAYRNYADQQDIYNSRVESYGSAQANAYCALPGFSEHHTGLAADLVLLDGDEVIPVGNIPEYQWILNNAENYGFVVRYAADKIAVTGISNEPWHFRYVGKAHATAMNTLHLCLEEYIEYIKNYSCDNCYTSYTSGASYKIYYCEGPKLTVPLFRPFSVSGNNVDGYIVTHR